MSASSKKKLRKEQNAELLTQKQQQAQADAKKLKMTTAIFVAAILVVVIVFVGVMAVNIVKNSGVMQKNTVAAVVNDEELSSVEFSYYYNDIINNAYSEWYSQYGDSVSTYMLLMGLDMSAPLDEQVYPMGDGEQTWADYFIDAALERAKSDYALYAAAQADGYELPEEEQASLESSASTLAFYAQLYGYRNVNKYLAAMYGPGANEDTYNAYSKISAIAASYYNNYSDSLSYDKDAIHAYAEDIATDYNGYDYAYYYVNYNKFLGEGTKDENGNTTHTDEENAAARAEAKAVAESLAKCKTVEELDAAIAALEINKGSTASSTKRTGDFGSALNSSFSTWLTNPGRKANDIAMFAYSSAAENHNHGDEEVDHDHPIDGYYVVVFQGMEDNDRPVGNVRHLLVKFENGTKDENGNTVYTDEQKAAVKQEADSYLESWKSGAATEESFIELVKKHSDDTSASTGGLFEDITPESSYVANFLNWSIDENRQVGDTEVIETEYGYHVMYYVGASELSYREMLIEEDMSAEALDNWYQDILENATGSVVELKHIDTDMIMAN